MFRSIHMLPRLESQERWRSKSHRIRSFEELSEGFTENKSWTYAGTDGNLQYKFFAAPYGSFLFRVQATHDAHIALTTERQEWGPMYELMIGSSGNTTSAIRKNRTKPNKAQINSPGILSDARYGQFWIYWHNGVIAAGLVGSSDPIITWTDPEPFRVFFIGVCTGSGVHGSWHIEDIRTDGRCPYLFFPVSNRVIKFKVRAAKEACVALTTYPEDKTSMFEVMIGEYNNIWSMVRENWLRTEYIATTINKTPGILSAAEFRSFWIKMNTNSFSLGMEDYKMPILLFWFSHPYPILYFGIRTDVGVAGSWKIEVTPSYPENLNPELRALSWIDASDGHIPFGAIEGGHEVNEEPAYVARVIQDDYIIPCKLVPSRQCAVVTWAGAEYKQKQYQVLVRSSPHNWVATSYNKIPHNALAGGETEDGKVTYVGRVHLDTGVIIGRVPAPDGHCYIMLNGEEKRYPHFGILVS